MPTMKRIIAILAGLCLSVYANAARPVVEFETTMGKFHIALYADEAPETVANFLRYVDEGFYEGTIFHRVIRRFVVQGGGFNRDMTKKDTHKPVINESRNGLHNERFTVAMARTDDPNSATSQFYVNLRLNPKLDRRMGEDGYTVFGEVTLGQEVIQDMSFVNTRTFAGMDDVPVQPIVVLKARRVE